MPDLNDLLELLPDDLGGVTGALDTVKEVLDEYPVVEHVLSFALKELQVLIVDAGLPDKVDKPVGADAIRAMAQGATSNLQESQSSLEQFIEWGLSSSEDIVGLIASLLGSD